jgi:hypothetical protein
MQGGRAEREGITISMVDPVRLAVGKAIEMEHTDDPGIAEEIALDHLTEFPRYYEALVMMEEMLKMMK